MAEERSPTRAEFNEYKQRMEDEHDRISHRLTGLENTVEKIGDLTVSVKELAVNMAIMAETLKEQNERLKTIESRDGDKWRSVIGYLISAIIGCGVTLLISHIF